MLTDVIIIGGGFAGTVTATRLARSGYNVVVVDAHANYPDDFRAEQLVGQQVVRRLFELNILTGLLQNLPVANEAIGFDQGRRVASVFTPHYGASYQEFVEALRRHLPERVRLLAGRVRSVETHDGVTVTLVDGTILTSRLLVMATGLSTTLSKLLGAKPVIVGSRHSAAVGFDVQHASIRANDATVMVFAGGQTSRIDYLTIFPCNGRLRANLFVYRQTTDPWMQQLRKAPKPTLLAVMPELRDSLGQFEIDNLRMRSIDLMVLTNYQRDRVVYIGDAFQTSCPAAGTGISRILTEVDCLLDQVDAWFQQDDFSVAALRRYYCDPHKLKCDRDALALAQFRRNITTSDSAVWRLHRQKIRASRFVKARLYHFGQWKLMPWRSRRKADDAPNAATDSLKIS